MAEIIHLAKVINEQNDKDNSVFAIRNNDGDLKDIEDWTGEDWEELVDGVFDGIAQRNNVSRWDVLADFIRFILEKE